MRIKIVVITTKAYISINSRTIYLLSRLVINYKQANCSLSWESLNNSHYYIVYTHKTLRPLRLKIGNTMCMYALYVRCVLNTPNENI